MKRNSSLLDKAIELLVQYFGVSRVQASLMRVANGGSDTLEQRPRRSSKTAQVVGASVTSSLENLRDEDEAKYRLLSEFYSQLKDRKILPEAQDIRHFAQTVGLKGIAGSSRKSMIPSLMRFLMERPSNRIKVDVEKAATISEEQRQRGFSVLTDKLLGGKIQESQGNESNLRSG